MRQVLVTGGGGFVGLALVKRLLELGVEPVVVGRRRYPELEGMDVELQVGDIRDAAFLNRACRGCDTVFHVAARAGIWGRRREYFSINLRGTENVIAACRKAGVATLVHTSTPSVVFAGADLTGADERLPYAGTFLCHYAHSKALAEQRVLAANSMALKTVALRPHLVWGPGDTNLIPRLLDRGRRGVLKQVGEGDNLVDIFQTKGRSALFGKGQHIFNDFNGSKKLLVDELNMLSLGILLFLFHQKLCKTGCRGNGILQFVRNGSQNLTGSRIILQVFLGFFQVVDQTPVFRIHCKNIGADI